MCIKGNNAWLRAVRNLFKCINKRAMNLNNSVMNNILLLSVQINVAV